jgi:hypothetical protein
LIRHESRRGKPPEGRTHLRQQTLFVIVALAKCWPGGEEVLLACIEEHG